MTFSKFSPFVQLVFSSWSTELCPLIYYKRFKIVKELISGKLLASFTRTGIYVIVSYQKFHSYLLSYSVNFFEKVKISFFVFDSYPSLARHDWNDYALRDSFLNGLCEIQSRVKRFNIKKCIFGTKTIFKICSNTTCFTLDIRLAVTNKNFILFHKKTWFVTT